MEQTLKGKLITVIDPNSPFFDYWGMVNESRKVPGFWLLNILLFFDGRFTTMDIRISENGYLISK